MIIVINEIHILRIMNGRFAYQQYFIITLSSSIDINIISKDNNYIERDFKTSIFISMFINQYEKQSVSYF